MFDTLKNAYDLAQNLRTLEVSSELNTKIAELVGQLLTAREEALALQATNASLLRKISELEQQLAETGKLKARKEEYQLLPVVAGNLAYFENAALKSGQAAPAYCQNCFDAGHLSVLQITKLHSLKTCECRRCGAKFGGIM